MALVLYFLSDHVAAIFTNDKNVIEATGDYLRIVLFAFGFQGIVLIVNSNINTLNKPLEASAIIFFQMLVIGVPLLFLLNTQLQLEGIYWAVAITYTVGGIISFIFNRRIVYRLASESSIQPNS